jgi:hypothetical protein
MASVSSPKKSASSERANDVQSVTLFRDEPEGLVSPLMGSTTTEEVGVVTIKHWHLEGSGELERELGEEALWLAFWVKVSTKFDFIDHATEDSAWHKGVECDQWAKVCPFDQWKKSKGAP